MLLKGDPRLYRYVECFTIIHWRPCSNIRHQCYQQIFPSYRNYHINHAVFVPVSYGHYNDVVMSSMASQITSLAIVYSAVYSGADQRKDQSSVSLFFVTPVPGEFPAQMASNAENVSIWWRHHGFVGILPTGTQYVRHDPYFNWYGRLSIHINT